MRIAFFSWETLNSLEVGGVAVVATKLAEALAQKGHEVHIFTRQGYGQREHEEINGVFEHRCVSPGCDDFVEYMDHLGDSLVSCFHYVEEKYGKFDIIHGHDWHVVNALCNIQTNDKREFIWSCHSTEWGRNGCSNSDSWFSKRISHREWLGGTQAKLVTTVSFTMKNELQQQYQTPEDKIHVIYNGIDLSEMKKEVDAGKVKERYGIHPLAPTVLFLGRMCHQKGPDLLLEAVPAVLTHRWDIKFIFAGGGQGMIDHINGRAKWLGVDHAIRVLGYVSDEVMVDLMNACDVVAVPSRNEPFGIITLEAWSAGKPVIAADCGGPGEIIENFHTGLKVNHTPESIAWGINYAFGDDGSFIKLMSQNALKRVQDFTWDKIAQHYLGVYDVFLGNPKKKSASKTKKNSKRKK